MEIKFTDGWGWPPVKKIEARWYEVRRYSIIATLLVILVIECVLHRLGV